MSLYSLQKIWRRKSPVIDVIQGTALKNCKLCLCKVKMCQRLSKQFSYTDLFRTKFDLRFCRISRNKPFLTMGSDELFVPIMDSGTGYQQPAIGFVLPLRRRFPTKRLRVLRDFKNRVYEVWVWPLRGAIARKWHHKCHACSQFSSVWYSYVPCIPSVYKFSTRFCLASWLRVVVAGWFR